jgi:hypothetical protein
MEGDVMAGTEGAAAGGGDGIFDIRVDVSAAGAVGNATAPDWGKTGSEGRGGGGTFDVKEEGTIWSINPGTCEAL